jgi:hypothetical protein
MKKIISADRVPHLEFRCQKIPSQHGGFAYGGSNAWNFWT